MASTAPLAYSIEPQPLSRGALVDASLTGDRIGFDAWLLPPEPSDRLERSIRLCSTAAGPLAFVVALACTVAWIV